MLSLSNMTSASGAAQYAALGDDYYMDAPDIMPEELLPDVSTGNTPILQEDEVKSDGRSTGNDETSVVTKNEAEVVKQTGSENAAGVHPNDKEKPVPEKVDGATGRTGKSEAEHPGKPIYNSMWVGEAAVKMGLSGRVKVEDYKRLLDGITP
ncbi:hypothetical protein CEY02_20250, partial [Bacillus pumilus]